MSIRIGAFFIGVNRTVGHYKSDMMVAIDRDKAKVWKQEHLDRFGPVELHGGRGGARGALEAYPWYDYFWPDLQGNGGTSVLLAARIALEIGFDEVILCGAPLEQGPYLDNEDDWSRRSETQMEAYRRPWRDMERCLRGKVFSMSGFTKLLLGEPDA